ncbi:hypothetical protein Tco_0252831 [Tanacetum coccineum]
MPPRVLGLPTEDSPYCCSSPTIGFAELCFLSQILRRIWRRYDDEDTLRRHHAEYPARRGDYGDDEVARLLAIPTPPPSPLSPLSSPLPQIPSPPLPVSPPLPASPTYPLGYRAAMIRLRVEAPSTSYSPQPHIILSHTRADTPPSGTP